MSSRRSDAAVVEPIESSRLARGWLANQPDQGISWHDPHNNEKEPLEFGFVPSKSLDRLEYSRLTLNSKGKLVGKLPIRARSPPLTSFVLCLSATSTTTAQIVVTIQHQPHQFRLFFASDSLFISPLCSIKGFKRLKSFTLLCRSKSLGRRPGQDAIHTL